MSRGGQDVAGKELDLSMSRGPGSSGDPRRQQTATTSARTLARDWSDAGATFFVQVSSNVGLSVFVFVAEGEVASQG